MANDGTTARLAEFLAGVSFEALPSEVVAASKTLLTDLLGSILGARDAPETRIATEVVRSIGGRGESAVIGHEFRTDCRNAAFLNSLASHVLELDDTHLPSLTHAGAVVIPATLAMAERQGLSGAATLAAIVIGYEACLRVAVAVQPSHWRRGFLTMGTCGVFGAAAAAGHCLGLRADQFASAFGLAGMQSAGINASSYGGGDMGRRLSPSNAASAGILSALLAKEGFTGTSTVLEGHNGFCQCFADEHDLSRITDNIGRSFMVLEVGLKPYCCNRLHHSAIDGLLGLMRQHSITPDSIADVAVSTVDAAVSGRPNRTTPTTLFDAKMSLPFSLAVACIRGGAGEREFSEDCIHDTRLQAFAAKVRVVSDPALSALFPRRWPARVALTTKDGRSFETLVLDPKGEPAAPMTPTELERKFLGLATAAVSDAVAAAILEEVHALDRRPDIHVLMDLLRGNSV